MKPRNQSRGTIKEAGGHHPLLEVSLSGHFTSLKSMCHCAGQRGKEELSWPQSQGSTSRCGRGQKAQPTSRGVGRAAEGVGAGWWRSLGSVGARGTWSRTSGRRGMSPRSDSARSRRCARCADTHQARSSAGSEVPSSQPGPTRGPPARSPRAAAGAATGAASPGPQMPSRGLHRGREGQGWARRGDANVERSPGWPRAAAPAPCRAEGRSRAQPVGRRPAGTRELGNSSALPASRNPEKTAPIARPRA